MTKKSRMEKRASGDDLEEMKQEIAKKSAEIKQLQKSLEEMKTKIGDKDTTGQTADVSKMVNDVSGLLNVGFGILGAPSRAQGEKSQGLIGLIDELGKLAEKSQTSQKTVNLGKHGVATFCVSSRSIRDSQTSKPASTLKISKPNGMVKKSSVTMPATAGTIKEREPIVDVFEEENCINVMVELPGVEENEIDLRVDESSLVISAGNAKERAYYRKVELPAPVKKGTIKNSYRNGILEVRLEKEKNTTTRPKTKQP